jgi:hypothetical protein
MSELERNLSALADAIEWPPTPRVALHLGERPRRIPRVALALALVACAIGVAFAVPPARSAILRFFHIGGATIIRVDTLPAAQERPLAVDLGRPVTRTEAERTLLAPFRVPKLRGAPRLYRSSDAISTLLAIPQPVLLTEVRFGSLQKLVGAMTRIESVRVVTAGDGVWLTGGLHVFVFPPTPPRVAGNVLLWTARGITFRLEGRTLSKGTALRLARDLTR